MEKEKAGIGLNAGQRKGRLLDLSGSVCLGSDPLLGPSFQFLRLTCSPSYQLHNFLFPNFLQFFINRKYLAQITLIKFQCKAWYQVFMNDQFD